MPVIVDVMSSQSGNGGGSGGGPMHAGAFESDTDPLFGGRFDHPCTNLPNVFAVGWIRCQADTAAKVAHQKIQRVTLFATKAFQLGAQPFQQTFTSVVPQQVEAFVSRRFDCLLT